MSPDFDDLVGTDVERSERERLRRVHDMLVQAGPPAELPPHIEAGPTLAMTLARPHRRVSRRVALLAAAVCVLALAFLAGYTAGNRGEGLAGARTLQLTGTRLAPDALASLRVLPHDASGNWPMTLSATGLPKLAGKGYYEVYLVRDGKVYAPCGSFLATGGPDTAVHVTLNAPYTLGGDDTWVITKQAWGDRARGPVVLRPTT